jgi:hypothetical protein
MKASIAAGQMDLSLDEEDVNDLEWIAEEINRIHSDLQEKELLSDLIKEAR